MNPVIFEHGLNHVIYQNGEVVPQDLQLYYWDNSAGRYKPVGTLAQIRDMPGSFNSNVVGNLDGFITRLGDVDDVVLYYNSTPDVPIVNIAPNGPPSPEPARIPIPMLQGYVRSREQYQTTEPAVTQVLAMVQAQLQGQGQAQAQAQVHAQVHAHTPIQYPQNAKASEDSVNRLLCDICDVNTKNVVFNCGHSICSDCNSKLPKRECPFCKRIITGIGPLFIGGDGGSCNGNKNDYKQKYLKYKNKYLELKKLKI